MEWLLAAASAVCMALWAWVAVRRSRRAADAHKLLLIRAERERDEQAARAQRADAFADVLGRAVLETVVATDRNLRVTYASAGARRVFGEEQPYLGQSLIEYTRSGELHELASDALATEPGGPVSADLDRVLSLDDQPFRVRAAPMADGVVLALGDISELQRLGRARRDFVANVSHELRTPLTSIRLLLEDLLSGSVRSSEEQSAALEKMQIEAEALEQIADELRDLSLLESGRMPVRLVAAPLHELAAAAIDRLAPQAEREQQTVRNDVPKGISVLADPPLIARVFGNLLHNAIKFTPPGGAILVTAEITGDDVTVYVADSGPGVTAEDSPRVFERFFRGDPSRSGAGTGLGLAIAKHIVEGHGGRIWIDEESAMLPGANLAFTLPRA